MFSERFIIKHIMLDRPSQITKIHEGWASATSLSEAEASIRAMCKLPSMEWRPYLDLLYVEATDEASRAKQNALRKYEDELRTALAEGFARDDGIIDMSDPSGQ